MNRAPFIIAIDGTAASGKGTLTAGLAEYLKVPYLDTGSIYRKLGYIALNHGVALDDVASLVQLAHSQEFDALFQQEIVLFNLHTPEISDAASKIAVHQSVREILNQCQRNFPIGKAAAIIDGRDIGTVIFPNADIKLFITAEVEIRAQRRYKQLISEKKDVIYEKVLADLKERDLRDSSRACSPTVPATDAIIVDTSYLDAKSVLSVAIGICKNEVFSHIKAA